MKYSWSGRGFGAPRDRVCCFGGAGGDPPASEGAGAGADGARNSKKSHRHYRGDAEDPSKRTLRQQESEAEQLALALGSDGAEGLMFRFAVETAPDGTVSRIVFLALRGEAGRVECLWPVPLDEGSKTPRNSGGFLQLPLSAGAKAASRPGPARKRAGPKGTAQEPGFLEGTLPIG